MKTIPLSQGKVVQVDDEDFIHLNLWNWYAKKSQSGNWYAVRMEGVRYRRMGRKYPPKKKKRKAIRMHNQIMNPPEEMIVHHKDENGLNNQKNNLVITTNSINAIEAVKAQKKKEYIPF